MTLSLADAVAIAGRQRSPVLGVEHLVLSILDGRSDTGRALRRAGVTSQIVLSAAASVEREGTTSEKAAPPRLTLGEDARECIARAKGVAAAYGEPVGDAQIVVALVWTDVWCLVQRAFQEAPGGRPAIADELRAAKVRVPESPPPAWPTWGEPRELDPESAAIYMDGLERANRRYLRKSRGGLVIVIPVEREERR